MISRSEPFSERLKKIMDEKNVRAVDLAKAIGVSEGTISQYRSGYTEPKRDRLADIANYLHVSPLYLMGLDDNQDVPQSNIEYMANIGDAEEIVEMWTKMKNDERQNVRQYMEFILAKKED